MGNRFPNSSRFAKRCRHVFESRLNEQVEIEKAGQVAPDEKVEYAGFLLFVAGRELRELKGRQKACEDSALEVGEFGRYRVHRPLYRISALL